MSSGGAVFVTGGTGVLGRPVVRLLIEAGYRVRGLAHTAASGTVLRSLGAEAAEGSLFDAGCLTEALRDATAVLHLATRIPPIADMRTPGAWTENDRIRTEGTRLLVDAALAADVATFVYPGINLTYPGSGDQWIDAANVPLDPLPVIRSSLAAEAEVTRFASAGRRGIVLRMGYFYHSDAPNTLDTVAGARRGVAMVIGARSAYISHVWVDDAAAAVVAALAGVPSGVYDVVDDEPVQRGELVTLIARAVGRRWLVHPSVWLMRLGAPGQLYAARSQRISNARFRNVSAWQPSVPSARDGWASIAAGLRVAPAALRGELPDK